MLRLVWWTRIFLPSLLLGTVYLFSACGTSSPSPQAATDTTQAIEAPSQSAASPTPTPIQPTATPPPPPTPDTRLPLSRTLNILLLGSDRRPNTPNWRTDVMMILALDLDQQKAGVISIPRDLYLEVIPGHSPNRANVVDYLGEQDKPNGGGPQLLTAIIHQKMGIAIDHYLRFDFDSFRDVVNALGGVDMDVHCTYYDTLYIDNPNDAVLLNVKPGHYKMDGNTALAYARSRRIGGDLDRARRQQEIVWAVRNEILQANLLPRIPALYAALSGAIQTDIDIVTAVRLTRFVLGLDKTKVHGFVLAPPKLLTPGWRQGMSIFVADWSAIADAVQHVFARPTFDDEVANACP